MTDTTRTRKPQGSRLERSNDERILAGVAGGLGDHLGINAWWFRLAFLVLAFFGGFGVLIYLAAWLVIPEQGHRDSIAGRWIQRLDVNDGGTIFGLVLVGVAAVIVLTAFADISGTLVVAAVLFVVGLLLYRGDLRPGTSSPPPGGGELDESLEHGTDDAQIDDDSTDDPESDDAAAPASSAISPAPPAPPIDPGDTTALEPIPPAPPRPPRERSMLGRLTLAATLIVVATMALVDLALARVEIAPVEYVAAAVAVVGLGLVVGAFIGKARWLIIVAALMLPFLWFASLAPENWSYSVGQVTHEPTQPSDVAEPLEHGIGTMDVDLTGLSAADLDDIDRIEVSLGIGEMVVVVPRGVVVHLRADAGMGEISGPFERIDGVGIDTVTTFGSGDATMELDLEVGLGAIRVRESGAFVDSVDSLSSERNG